MEPFKHDVTHAFALRAFLDDFRDTLGQEKLDALLAEFGVTSSELDDSSAWIPLALFEGILSRLVEVSGDPDLIQRCGRKGLSLRYLGPLRPLVRIFGSPAFTYQRLPQELPRFNKRMECRWQRIGRARGRISFHNLPDAPTEKTDLVCRLRRAQMEAVPMLFDLAPARVAHPRCIVRGDEACVYEVSWQEPWRKLWSLAGLVPGAAIGSGLALWYGWGSVGAVALAAAFSAAVWALGRVYELKGEVASRVEELAEHNEALVRSAKANEDRFAELLEAKTEVDQKVEERTAELRETSRRLAETLERVEALSRTKSEFFSNVSHDLRTPLTLLAGPLDDLVAGRDPPGGFRVAIEAMQRNTSRLLRLINQLLDLSKIDAGRMELHRTPVDLCRLAESAVEQFASAAQAKGISLALQAPQNMALFALDSAWIESIFSNLIANALRFVGEGGVIWVRVRDLGAELKIEVEDSGAGIPSAQLSQVFERFAQAGDYRARRGGTGIGLALVQEAARLHGGEVSVKSELGKGTLFEVSLPRIVCQSDPEEKTAATPPALRLPNVLDDSPQERPAAGEEKRDGPSPDAPLVLVVEDHPDTRRFVADVLAAEYQVRTAAGGAEGLAKALELRPDVVVTDVDMPEMDGFALCRELRGRDGTRATPILLLTAISDPSSVAAGFNAGADDYVPKPFHGRELLARVRVQLRLRRMVGEMAHKARLAILGVTAASVAHRVRNPLNAIISGLDAFRKRHSNIDPASQEMLNLMIDCSRRIEEVTNDLMNISRIDRAVQERWHAADGLAACVRLIQSRLPAGVSLNCSIDPAAEIEGRPGDLNQVFLNLLDNALRAVGEQGLIEVKAERNNRALQVTVADSGSGVASGMEDRIFSPFITTRPANEGTGLGLSISRQVIEQHGGQISVSGSPLGGAMFRVTIPLAKPMS